MRVISGGSYSLIEDWPGRHKYRYRGVSPSGAVDDIAYRAANLLVGNIVGDLAGNPVGDAVIEISGGFFEAEFLEETLIAITGADMAPTINGVSVPVWQTIRVRKGDFIKFDACKRSGFTSYLANSGGIDVPPMWGSRSTCVKEHYGGFKGRVLEAGDEINLGRPMVDIEGFEGRRFKSELIPPYVDGVWNVRATPGPRSAPDYFTEEGMDVWFSQPFQVDHNSSRYAYRLRNPKPLFSRKTGGAGGNHPSMVILETYHDPGCLNVAGDYAIILFKDCVSMGGYTCPLSIINADLWKVGQAVPLKDSIKFEYCSPEEARGLILERDSIFCEQSIEKVPPVMLQTPSEVSTETKTGKVLAPMPGLVARVVVNVGDTVKKGEVVAVLNVMKTEIQVNTAESGTVKEILVEEWDEMETGTPMIILE